MATWASKIIQLTLRQGSTEPGTAPQKFTAGPLMTTTENGALEFDGDYFYATSGLMTGIVHRRRIVTAARVVSFNDEPIFMDDDLVIL